MGRDGGVDGEGWRGLKGRDGGVGGEGWRG